MGDGVRSCRDVSSVALGTAVVRLPEEGRLVFLQLCCLLPVPV